MAMRDEGEAGGGPSRQRRLLVVDADAEQSRGLVSALVGLGHAVFGPLTEPREAARQAGGGWDAALIADEPGGAWSRPAAKALAEQGVPFAMLRAGDAPRGAELAGTEEVPSVPRDVHPDLLGGLVAALLASAGRPSQRARLCLFDERRLTRDVLAEWLTLVGPEYEVTAHDVPDEDSCACADVAVIHLAGRPVGSDAQARGIARLRDEAPGVPIAVLTDREDEDHLREALALGVRGYIPTSYDREVMLGAIRLLHVGGVFVPAPLLRRDGEAAPTGEETTEGTAGAAADGAAATPDPSPKGSSSFPGLSERQAQVLGLMAEGHPNKIIAHELGLKEATVKMHAHHVMQKLGVTNRTQAARMLNTLALAAQ